MSKAIAQEIRKDIARAAMLVRIAKLRAYTEHDLSEVVRFVANRPEEDFQTFVDNLAEKVLEIESRTEGNLIQ